LKPTPYYQKWRDDPVLFLDDGFDNDRSYACLQEAGYQLERFNKHFPDAIRIREQSVKDPPIIKLCNRHGWVLVTLDKNIVNAHRMLISESQHIGIVAACHNNAEDVMVWAESLVKLKPRLYRNSFKKRLRPWFVRFNTEGKFSSPIEFVTKPT
jgi:hypothetical protein